MGVRLAAKRCSLSRLGIVDGAKCSFLRIVCLMMFRRSRMASIRDSAVPNTVNEWRALWNKTLTTENSCMCLFWEGLLLETSPFWRPMP